MKRLNKNIATLSVLAAAALYWLNAGIYLGYEMVPAGTDFYKTGKLPHAIMVCHYFDLKNGYSGWPAWPPGTKPGTALANGLLPHVAKNGCPGRWPWQAREIDDLSDRAIDQDSGQVPVVNINELRKKLK